jgi:hypothetical protein
LWSSVRLSPDSKKQSLEHPRASSELCKTELNCFFSPSSRI